MPKKKLQNRINSLFAELADDQDRRLESVDALLQSPLAEVEITHEITPGEGQHAKVNELSSSDRGEKLEEKSEPVLKDIHPDRVASSIGDLKVDQWRYGQESPAIISMPITVKDQQHALLEIFGDTPDRIWSDNERRLVKQVSDQLSMALENAFLFQETQAALAETDRLYQASLEINAVKSYEDILNTLQKRTLLGKISVEYIDILCFDQPWSHSKAPATLFSVVSWISPVCQKRIKNSPVPALRTRSDSVEIYGSLIHSDRLIHASNLSTRSDLLPDVRHWYVEILAVVDLLFVPLVVGGQWIGFIEAAFNREENLTPNDLRSLQAMASQVAIAIQNLRLLEETKNRAAQLETAAEIARDSSGTLKLDDLLNRAVRLIRERYGYYQATIFLLDETERFLVVKAASGPAAEDMLANPYKVNVGSSSLVGMATESGQTIVVNDINENPLYALHPFLPDARSETVIPLKLGGRVVLERGKVKGGDITRSTVNERVIGVLNVHSTVENIFSTDAIAVLSVLVDQLAVAVDNTRAYELAQQAIIDTRQRVQELSTIYSVSQALSSATMQTSEIAHRVVEEFVDLFSMDRASLLLYDQEENVLRVLAVALPGKYQEGDAKKSLVAGFKVSSSMIRLETYPAVEQVMQSLQPLVVHKNSDLFPNFENLQILDNQNLAEALIHRYSQILVLIPLAVKGHSIGIVQMESRQDEAKFEFSVAQSNLAMTIANAAAVFLENAQLYEEQLETSEKLRELDKLKSQFLANMSHELRTPLNSIIGFSRVILKGIDGPTTELQQQDLTAIHNSGTHLLELINDVLDISKIEAGKMELAFDDGVYIPDLANSAMSTAIGLTKDKPIRLERFIEPDLPLVRADPTRIRQVLINFLSNAAKFTDRGTITVRVVLRTNFSEELNVSQSEIVVSVTDTGPGISSEDQKKLFRPFSQVDSSPTRKVGGSGLGLSISRLLVELHGGRIGVDSVLGRGSTFYFTLPVLTVAPGENEEFPVGVGGDQLPELKQVLIIEDDKQVIKLYERYLNEHGFAVVSATDPLQALDMARNIQPFAITLDVMMPRRDGWEVLEQLKNDPATANIPVIICSIIENPEKGLNLGAVDYLTKPIVEEDLIRALDRLRDQIDVKDVLMIDDDQDDLRLVEKVLSNQPGIKFQTASGGTEGLVLIQTRPPQVVILDLFMPDVDGFMVLEVLKQDDFLRNIPVIVFTAGDLTQSQKNKLKSLASGVIYKSAVTEEELLSKIMNVLEQLSST
jgi:signal transduction histidine kinase/CheY-like chemotaxis protein/putative methionine-R-sulfoxide reductase with GAF domain